jgi:steroid delta-isomerase-like uncharacterized protein
MASTELVTSYLAAYNTGDWDTLQSFVSSEYVHHNNAATLDIHQFLSGAAWLRDAMPDFHIDVQDLFADGDRVAVRFIGRGTHTSPLVGEAPTDNELALHGIMIYRIDNGLIAEDWEAMDEHDLLRQIGALSE